MDVHLENVENTENVENKIINLITERKKNKKNVENTENVENKIINLITERKKNKKSCELESLIADAASEKNFVREDVITTLEKRTEKEVIECKYYAKRRTYSVKEVSEKDSNINELENDEHCNENCNVITSIMREKTEEQNSSDYDWEKKSLESENLKLKMEITELRDFIKDF